MKIGIIGAGQLARMLAIAGIPLGIKTLCIEANTSAPASDVTEVIQTSFQDNNEIKRFLQEVEFVTFETENIPYDFVKSLNDKCKLHPNLAILKIAQDRLYEKNLFTELAIPTVKYINISSFIELENAIQRFNLPLILKTRRSGYDGKGQALIRTIDEAKVAWEKLSQHELIAEQFIKFDFEVSLIAVRDQAGHTKFYPLTYNVHEAGILRISKAPFHHPDLQATAEHYAETIMKKLDYIGVLAIEFFYDGQQLIANEMAPRVHNSGHWTIEGAETSQFENHLRAIAGLPLGETTPRGFSAMVNFIGEEPNIAEMLAIPNTHYHTYHKIPLPNRKLGHLTLRADSEIELEQQLQFLLQKMQAKTTVL